jgi:hypothetical protein
MITDEQLRNWERGAAEAAEISIDIVRIGGVVHAPIPGMGTEYALGTIDFANDAREAVPALIAEVRRLRALIGEPPVVESQPQRPTVVLSTAPIISTPEEAVVLFGWHIDDARGVFADVERCSGRVAIFTPRSQTDAPPDSRPGSPR